VDDAAFGPYALGGSGIGVFGANVTQVWISNNGLLSFGDGVSSFVPAPFPIGNGNPVVAPLWQDVDTRLPIDGGAATGPNGAVRNSVYLRTAAGGSVRPADAARLTADVAATFPGEPAFTPVAYAVGTWFAVGRFPQENSQLNTYQAVVAADASRRSYAFLCFDQLLWGWGAAAPNVWPNSGFNAGDGVNSYSLPGSFSDAVLQFTCRARTSVTPGCFGFRIDARDVSPGSPASTATATATGTATRTQTSTQTPSQTRTSSQTPSQTPTQTSSPSQSPSPSQTPSQAPPPSLTPTQSGTPSSLPTRTPPSSQTRTPTPTASLSGVPSQTGTPTSAPPTGTPAATRTRSPTPTPSLSAPESWGPPSGWIWVLRAGDSSYPAESAANGSALPLYFNAYEVPGEVAGASVPQPGATRPLRTFPVTRTDGLHCTLARGRRTPGWDHDSEGLPSLTLDKRSALVPCYDVAPGTRITASSRKAIGVMGVRGSITAVYSGAFSDGSSTMEGPNAGWRQVASVSGTTFYTASIEGSPARRVGGIRYLPNPRDWSTGVTIYGATPSGTGVPPVGGSNDIRALSLQYGPTGARLFATDSTADPGFDTVWATCAFRNCSAVLPTAPTPHRAGILPTGLVSPHTFVFETPWQLWVAVDSETPRRGAVQAWNNVVSAARSRRGAASAALSFIL
jgi:hypothetical protein